jgi:hypothetical protein
MWIYGGKVALGQVFPSTSVFPADFHSTDCFTFISIYQPGLTPTPRN